MNLNLDFQVTQVIQIKNIFLYTRIPYRITCKLVLATATHDMQVQHLLNKNIVFKASF